MKKKTYFGKLKKSPEMNMNCFIISASSLLTAKQQGAQSTQQDQKNAKKFKKYLLRMNQVMEGNCKKLPNTPENMYKLAFETQNLKDEFAQIIMNIGMFEFEDRKNIQIFISDLYNNFNEVIEETLDYKKSEILRALVERYTQQNMSTFVGNLLRLFTKSSRLNQAFQNIEILQDLAALITNPDFNISSDAYETFKEVFLNDRPNDQSFETFLTQNYQEIFTIFDSLENDSNYFAKREGLKTQYMLLAKNENLRKLYTQDKERLKKIMLIILDQNKGIQYEAFLLLSLFILMPQQDEKVLQTLRANKKNLNDFIKTFQNEREEEDFFALKNRMRELLDEL